MWRGCTAAQLKRQPLDSRRAGALHRAPWVGVGVPDQIWGGSLVARDSTLVTGSHWPPMVYSGTGSRLGIGCPPVQLFPASRTPSVSRTRWPCPCQWAGAYSPPPSRSLQGLGRRLVVGQSVGPMGQMAASVPVGRRVQFFSIQDPAGSRPPPRAGAVCRSDRPDGRIRARGQVRAVLLHPGPCTVSAAATWSGSLFASRALGRPAPVAGSPSLRPAPTDQLRPRVKPPRGKPLAFRYRARDNEARASGSGLQGSGAHGSLLGWRALAPWGKPGPGSRDTQPGDQKPEPETRSGNQSRNLTSVCSWRGGWDALVVDRV